jgi:predicted DsbA family dithiol-disulfide isomerase
MFFDFTSPWCYLSTRRLQATIRALSATVQARVAWQPFRVHAEGPWDALQQSSTREFVTALGAAEGIEFGLDRIINVPDTFDAHRLVWLAARDRVSGNSVDDLVERIYRAHLSEGRDIESPATLATLAGESGLDPHRVAALLAGRDGAEEVRALEHRATHLGIEAVPFLLINGMVGVRGSPSSHSLYETIQGASWFGLPGGNNALPEGATR